ncbi:GNAT family N-acetyltransferase [Williamsia herbipolensis]|uniref:GNAT family N-acetyltransferase n=1 Tax=Williamsia herbipolensis TaxID=1603258 RepID=UPI0005F83A0F|nr:GNAT family N-acetyltransferase [Williamsia herbipolensis]
MATIRPIESRDSDQWSPVFEQYRAFDHLAPDPAVIKKVWGWLSDPQHNLDALVVEDHSEIVGFALYRQFPRPVTATTGVYLDDLYVVPSSRGRGHAQQLITAVTDIANANHATLIRWICAQDNTIAQHLYERIATRTAWITYEDTMQ